MVKKRGLGRRGAEGTFWVIISAIIAILVLVVLFIFFTGEGGALVDRFRGYVTSVVTQAQTALSLSEESFGRIIKNPEAKQRLLEQTFEKAESYGCSDKKDDAIREYKEFLEKGKETVVGAKSEKYVKLYGKDDASELMFRIGKCYQGYKIGETENKECAKPVNAIERFDELQSWDSSNKYYIESLFREAMCLEKLGKYSEAREVYDEILSRKDASIDDRAEAERLKKEGLATVPSKDIVGSVKTFNDAEVNEFNKDVAEITSAFWGGTKKDEILKKLVGFYEKYAENYQSYLSNRLTKNKAVEIIYIEARSYYELKKYADAGQLFDRVIDVGDGIRIEHPNADETGPIKAWAYYYLAKTKGDPKSAKEDLTKLFIEFPDISTKGTPSTKAYEEIRKDCKGFSGGSKRNFENCIDHNRGLDISTLREIDDRFKDLRCWVDEIGIFTTDDFECKPCRDFKYEEDGCDGYDHVRGKSDVQKICDENPCGVKGGCTSSSYGLVGGDCK